jgi:pimeloyl-ACP methyl ester carboxylesterase
MSSRLIDVHGRKVEVLEAGKGAPLVYLHGFMDVHGLKPDLMDFHQRLAKTAKLIAPAHPGIGQSEENVDITSIEDVASHYLEVFDALDLKRFDLAGHGIGGWIAAEFAVRYPEKVARLILIDAMGLLIPDQPITDIFAMAQSNDTGSNENLRTLLFRSPKDAIAHEMVPDGQMLRLGSWNGFKPPDFYDGALTERLHRIEGPSLVIWADRDKLVPNAHGKRYAELLPACFGFKLVKDSGHSTVAQQPAATAKHVTEFLA